MGVLLAQLGTPDAPTPRALKRYLCEFLSDRRVVDLHPLLWQPLLHGIILRLRPRRSAALYRRIWQAEGSPLLHVTKRLAKRLGNRLQKRHGNRIRLGFGMRYGRPSLEDAAQVLMEAGCARLLLFPLYPQYCTVTTASTLDKVWPFLRRRYAVPALRVMPPFPEHPAYIRALARSVVASRQNTDHQAEMLLISFHGEPLSYQKRGDPYREQCASTARALARTLCLPAGTWRLAFQSRFGPGPWLRPYLVDVLCDLARQGIRHVEVVMPGFAADCLETLDEVGRLAAELFVRQGGQSLRAIPCLNTSETWLDALEELIDRELTGWI